MPVEEAREQHITQRRDVIDIGQNGKAAGKTTLVLGKVDFNDDNHYLCDLGDAVDLCVSQLGQTFGNSHVQVHLLVLQ